MSACILSVEVAVTPNYQAVSLCCPFYGVCWRVGLVVRPDICPWPTAVGAIKLEYSYHPLERVGTTWEWWWPLLAHCHACDITLEWSLPSAAYWMGRIHRSVGWGSLAMYPLVCLLEVNERHFCRIAAEWGRFDGVDSKENVRVGWIIIKPAGRYLHWFP